MKKNDRMHGFTVTETRELPELSAVMVRMTHDKTGLELVWLQRDEENKTFSISFKTLPENDTGVFHILEHSVLCGSDLYPVKEPFVELLKSSLNTFLNAMTFPDKTMYPVSSRNEKDFVNLTRVYLDAVFRPLIYKKPEIFRQEGWHYTFGEDGKPGYKGVVFNEMKGAMADVDELSDYAMQKALFPESPYGFNSGGDPAHIPDLTYEEFLANHRRFYSPSNAYVFMDGKLDIDAMLSILNDEYLKDFERTERIGQPAFQKPVDGGTVEVEYELGAGEDPERRMRLAWGSVAGTFDEREKLTAARVLADVLIGDNQAPLKRAVLDRGLAEDITMVVMDEVFQPRIKLEVKNFAAADQETVEGVVTSELRRLSEEGLDHGRIRATLANMEFNARERDSGTYPPGLIMAMQSLETWLYGGDPAANLEVGSLYTDLAEKVEQGYFENLLRELLLENPHRCKVVLKPSKTAGEARRKMEADRLARESAAWTDEAREELRAEEAALTAWQSSEDTPENLAKLPMLTLSDVSPEPELFPIEIVEEGGVKLLRHDVATSGIVYVNLFFDAGDLSEEELSELAFTGTLLGKLSTKRHTSKELSEQVRLLCGYMSFGPAVFGSAHGDGYSVKFTAGFSTLEKNLPAALELLTEILTETVWDEDSAALDLLRQTKMERFQYTVMAGHAAALGRVNAQIASSGVAQECTGGFTYYKWLTEQESAWDWTSLKGKLSGLLARAVSKARLTASVTGGGAEAARTVGEKLSAVLPEGGKAEAAVLAPWGIRREGIAIPADIAFAAAGSKLTAHGGEYSGTAILGAQIVSLAYLWNVIRVQGGAYGTGLLVRNSGNAICYSFRDPSAAQSLEKYKGAGEFLRQMAGSGMDLTGFIIGAVAGTEPLMSPRLKGATADNRYWTGITAEDLRRWRRELLAASPEGLRAFADVLEAAIAQGGVCVVGSKEQLDACGPLDVVETL